MNGTGVSRVSKHHTILGPVVGRNDPLEIGRDADIATDRVVGIVELVRVTPNVGSATHEQVLLGQLVTLPDIAFVRRPADTRRITNIM